METRKDYFRMDRREIAFLKFLLEAYDGIGMISTLDREQGVVLIRTAPGCESEMATLLEEIGNERAILPLDTETVRSLGIPEDVLV